MLYVVGVSFKLFSKSRIEKWHNANVLNIWFITSNNIALYKNIDHKQQQKQCDVSQWMFLLSANFNLQEVGVMIISVPKY